MVAASIQFTALTNLLTKLKQDGGFDITVLTDMNGLVIAASKGSGDASEAQSAGVAKVQQVMAQVQDHLSMDTPEEMTFNDVYGKKLVCRSFLVEGSPVILTVFIPSRAKSYRKLMNSAIREIQRVWDS